jgi:hypothetical protein
MSQIVQVQHLLACFKYQKLIFILGFMWLATSYKQAAAVQQVRMHDEKKKMMDKQVVVAMSHVADEQARRRKIATLIFLEV